MFVSGDLLVTLAKKSDSGQYICEVINEEGIDIASSNVLVKGKYSKTCLKRPLKKRQNKGLNDKW